MAISCQCCGRAFPTRKQTAAAAAGPVNLAAMSDADIHAHYKATSLLEDARFAINTGRELSADLRLDWALLVSDIESRHVTAAVGRRRLTALQERWRKERQAVNRPALGSPAWFEAEGLRASVTGEMMTEDAA